MPEVRYAVLIGCNRYPEDPPSLPELRCAENDAKGFRDLLIDRDIGGFEPSNVHLFTNESHSEILIGLARCLQQAKRDDLVLVYFSGHGKLDKNNKLHLATSDTNTDILGVTSIPVATVKDQLDKSESEKLVLILDSCYSGAAGATFKGGDVESELQIASSGKGKYIMAASTAIQVAEEKEGEDNSLFTKYLLEGLKTGDADSAGNGTITADELFAYAREQVVQNGRQEPIKFALGVSGELIIAGARQPRRLRTRTLATVFADGELSTDEYNFAVGLVAHDDPSSDEEKRLIELLDGVRKGEDPTGCVVFIRTLRTRAIEQMKEEVKTRAADYRHEEMYKDALSEWNRVLEIDEADAEAIRQTEDLRKILDEEELINNYLASAVKNYEEGKYVDAIAQWVEVLRLNSESANAITGIGENLQKIKDAVGSLSGT